MSPSQPTVQALTTAAESVLAPAVCLGASLKTNASLYQLAAQEATDVVTVPDSFLDTLGVPRPTPVPPSPLSAPATTTTVEAVLALLPDTAGVHQPTLVSTSPTVV